MDLELDNVDGGVVGCRPLWQVDHPHTAHLSTSDGAREARRADWLSRVGDVPTTHWERDKKHKQE